MQCVDNNKKSVSTFYEYFSMLLQIQNNFLKIINDNNPIKYGGVPRQVHHNYTGNIKNTW